MNLKAILFSLFLVPGIVLNTSAQEEEYEDFDEEIVTASIDTVSRVSYYDLIPARYFYNHIWDTLDINPYDVDVMKFNDTIHIKLVEDTSCVAFIPITGRITSTFGYRRLRRTYRFHHGMDVDLNTGDEVRSAFDGMVRVAKYSSSYGNVVVVRHYNGLETLYAHFSELKVQPGQTVRAGEVLGLGGSSGRSTGSHLHFEVRFRGLTIDPQEIFTYPEFCIKGHEFTITRSTFKHIIEAKTAKYVRVKSGDTLSAIAYRNGTTVTRLCQLNHISRTSIIRIGQTIRVR